MIAATGVLLGIAYTLSPLAVLSLVVVVVAAYHADRGLSAAESRWFRLLVTVAVLLRLMAIAALFLASDPSQPFASFFGDEELYKFRTVWVRNLGQGIPISPADVIYSYDDVGRTSHLFALALVQALVGDAPYGLHLLSMMLYFCGVLALYRFIRLSFGGVVAMAGLAGLLFIPSLAVWSISVLKEPMNVFTIAAQVMCAVYAVRARGYGQKALAVAGVLAFGFAMESLRAGGLATAVGGMLAGAALIWLLERGRRLLAALVIVPAVIVALAGMEQVQNRVLGTMRAVAFHHAGHVLTPGQSYQLVDPDYYPSRIQLLESMPADDAARYALAAMWSYFVQPLPWLESRTVRAYLPEQVAWYGMVFLVPFGVVAGLRRDRVLTVMLVTHAVIAILIVALTSGNIGTLIRHRSLVLVYLIWLSALGAQDGIRRMLERTRNQEGSRVDGDR